MGVKASGGEARGRSARRTARTARLLGAALLGFWACFPKDELSVHSELWGVGASGAGGAGAEPDLPPTGERDAAADAADTTIEGGSSDAPDADSVLDAAPPELGAPTDAAPEPTDAAPEPTDAAPEPTDAGRGAADGGE